MKGKPDFRFINLSDFMSISGFISLSFIILNRFVESCLNVPYLSLWALQYKERGVGSIHDPGVKVEMISSSSFPSPLVKEVAEIIIAGETRSIYSS